MSKTSTRVKYEKTDIYESLVDEYDIFDSYVDFFMFAASLGYSENNPERENYEGENEMLWMHVQNKELYQVVAAAIAYQDTDDPQALVDPEIQLPILAQYAAGGAEKAAEEFGDVAGDPTDAVVNFLQDEHSESTQDEEEDILNQIRNGFDETVFN